MAKAPNPIILIPARLASTRLPDKPLADIHGETMIVHCWRRAVEADIGRVVVASADAAIADAVLAAGGEAVLTDPAHPSGSDRIHEGVQLADPNGRHDIVINMQGDSPNLAPIALHATLDLLSNPNVDIGTVAAETVDEDERDDPSAVKAVVAWEKDENHGRALYFTRATAPSGDGPLYHHIGLYAYRRTALERFVALPRSPLEIREGLEQLRAMEAGMRIDVACVDTVPLTVDTPADLARARSLMQPQDK
ncbi:MAG: 3-deoxy-manno-octulosonate cytidylyltransferase [Rhodospirillaceae bacterium]|nr:3-deoxy-manno-octulosonate cytidylyltransferase [Rhodospirillaceae bacterium]